MTLFEWSGASPRSETNDAAVDDVYNTLLAADPTGHRIGAMMRSTLDQLYDGQRTGRYSWEQLYKTERTHFGTLFEINLQREFDDVIQGGNLLDYRIAGHDVDCKFSQSMFGWMIPPEAVDQVLIVGTVSDRRGEFAFGVVRASEEHLGSSRNRDGKRRLNKLGQQAIVWLHRPGDLPPNVLLDLDPETVDQIFAGKSGQERVNRLFRLSDRRLIGRNTVATVAQQDDYMKRVRANGGARDSLRAEGIVILSGDYSIQREAARALGLVVPAPGQLVSARVVPASADDSQVIELEGTLWRCADDLEPSDVPAPVIPRN